jgi:hypothetical protein
MGQKIFSVLVLSALFSAHACAMQAGPAPEQELDGGQDLRRDGQPAEQVAAEQEQEPLNAEQQDAGDPFADLPDLREDLPEEGEIYGDVVINERTGVTRFINDIIEGCVKKWDEQKFLGVVQEHIADGVRINKSCRERRTPLMYACWFQAPFCVIKALRSAGGSVRRCRDREGRTALRYACQPKNPSYAVIKLLLDTGARADIADHDGGAPVDYVWRNPNADKRVKNLLLKSYKAELQYDESVRMLLQKKNEERRARRYRQSDELPVYLEEKEVDSPEILIRRIG